MSQGIGKSQRDQCYCNVNDKTYIERAIDFFYIALAYGHGNKTIGGGNHRSVDHTHECYNTRHHCYQSEIAHSKSLESITGGKYGAKRRYAQSGIKQHRIDYYCAVGVFFHIMNFVPLFSFFFLDIACCEMSL